MSQHGYRFFAKFLEAGELGTIGGDNPAASASAIQKKGEEGYSIVSVLSPLTQTGQILVVMQKKLGTQSPIH